MISEESRYREFWKLFNAEKFFEAHEVLETLWLRTAGPEREFYQGLIQIAAAFVHVQKGTPAGGLELLKKASQKLELYEEGFGGIQIRDLLKKTALVFDAGESFPKIHIQ